MSNSIKDLPINSAEAEKLVGEIHDKILDIQTQLGDKNQCYEDGSRMDYLDYHTWRTSASTALRYRVRDLRDAKANLKLFKTQEHEARTHLPAERFQGYLRMIISEARKNVSFLPPRLMEYVDQAHAALMEYDNPKASTKDR